MDIKGSVKFKIPLVTCIVKAFETSSMDCIIPVKPGLFDCMMPSPCIKGWVLFSKLDPVTTIVVLSLSTRSLGQTSAHIHSSATIGPPICDSNLVSAKVNWYPLFCAWVI